MVDENGNVVKITLEHVYNAVNSVDEKVSAMQGHGDRLDDHEKRIRRNERTLAIAIGAGLVLEILAPLLWIHFGG